MCLVFPEGRVDFFSRLLDSFLEWSLAYHSLPDALKIPFLSNLLVGFLKQLVNCPILSLSVSHKNLKP